MSDSPILAERVGNQNGILWVTLNRPEKMNALTFPLLHEMRDIFVDARNDRSLRCVVITGSGRGFCAGMDMGGGANPDAPPPPDDHPDPEGRRLNMRNEVEAYIALRRLEVVLGALRRLQRAGAHALLEVAQDGERLRPGDEVEVDEQAHLEPARQRDDAVLLFIVLEELLALREGGGGLVHGHCSVFTADGAGIDGAGLTVLGSEQHCTDSTKSLQTRRAAAVFYGERSLKK